MADRIRGSCRGCLCFRNRGINDLAICRLERAAFLFEALTGLSASGTRGALDTTENGLAASICFAIVIAVDTRVLSIIKSYECVAVAMNTSKWNELISSDKTCSKYTIAYSEKGANEIDRVYYSGDGKDPEYPHK